MTADVFELDTVCCSGEVGENLEIWRGDVAEKERITRTETRLKKRGIIRVLPPHK